MKYRVRNKQSLAFIIVFALFCAYALTLIYPFLWTLMTTLKTESDYNLNRVGFPTEWHFGNFSKAFAELNANDTNLLVMLFNSLWYSFGGTLIGVFVSTLSAYVVSKYRFPGRSFIYGLALVTMMLPIVGALPSQYTMYGTLNILDTPLMLITFANGFGFNFIMLFAFFKSLPWSYIEAAYLDGGNHFNVFMRVMLPQAMPVISSLAVVAFIGVWNDYYNPILFLESYPTLSMGLYVYQSNIKQNSIDIPMLFAGVVMSVVPILVTFIVFQNSIMSLSIGGGLKG